MLATREPWWWVGYRGRVVHTVLNFGGVLPATYHGTHADEPCRVVRFGRLEGTCVVESRDGRMQWMARCTQIALEESWSTS